MSNPFFALLFILFLHVQIHGQSFAVKGSIEGLVIDNINKEPLAYSSVGLYRVADSAIVSGVVTDSIGHFYFDKIVNGNYYLEIQFVGFKKKAVSGIQLSSAGKKIALGKILVTHSEQLMKEVVITGKQLEKTEYLIDKKIINVSKDADAATGTAIDILEKTPSVKVDIDGKITIRDRSDILVLIDGKPTTLKGSDALSSISASMIDRIEIINNPSAKYEAGGLGGVINIILKTKKMQGISAIANLNAGIDDKKKADISAQYNAGIVKFNGQIKYSEYSNYGESWRNRKVARNDSSFFTKDRFNKRVWLNLDKMVKIGTVLDLPKFKMGVDLKYGWFGIDKTKDGMQQSWTIPSSSETSSIVHNSTLIDWYYFEAGENMDFIFNKPEHLLKTIFLYANSKGKNLYDFNALNAIDNNLILKTTDLQIINQNDYRFQADYTLPSRENGKMEMGIRSSLSNENLDYATQVFDTTTVTLKNNMLSNTAINAAYINYVNKIAKFNYQIGLRSEYTNREITTNANGGNYIFKKIGFFPSVFIDYPFPNGLKITASYNKRIKQPEPWIIVPFITHNDLYNITVGNPNLRPEYSHNAEIGITKELNKGIFSITGFNKNIINNIWMMNTQLKENLFKYSYINVDNKRTLGVELGISQRLSKYFDIDFNTSFFSRSIQGKIDSSIFSYSNFMCDLKASINIAISNTTKLQIYSMYLSSDVTPQGGDKPYYYTNLTLKQDLFKKMLSISFKVSNVFNGRSINNLNGSNFSSEYSQWRYRTYVLGLVYNFHHYTEPKNKNPDIERGAL